MKWNTELPKSEFLKINCSHFIANEKLNSELVHEKNASILPKISQTDVTQIEKKTEQITNNGITNQHCSKTRKYVSTIDKTDSSNRQQSIKYISECIFEPVTKPVRYIETLIIETDTKKMSHNEEVSYETKFYPSKWSETMFAHVKKEPKRILTEAFFDIEQEYHYIPLQNQQTTDAGVCEL